MEGREGVMRAAVDAEGTTTEQPEHDLQPRDPAMVGAAPPDEKKGIAGKVKGMMGRGGRKKKRNQETAVAKGGVLDKIKAKASGNVGRGKDGSKSGPARLLSMSSSSSSMSSSDEEDVGTVGFAMDPTGPVVAGPSLGRQDFSNAPTGPGAQFSNLALHDDDDDALRRHSERAKEYSKTSNPMHSEYAESLTPTEHGASPTRNSHLTPSDDAPGDRSHPYPGASEAHVSNSEGGSGVAGDHHRNDPRGESAKDEGFMHVSEGGSGVAGEHHGNDPRGESAKDEGLMQRILNKVH